MARGRRQIGSHPLAVRIIKQVVSPLDRLVVKLSRGRIRPPSSLVVPTLLLTVPGRRTGIDRTVPLIYVTAGDRYVVANARPAGEGRNPWVANLRAAGSARIRLGRGTLAVRAEELSDAEAGKWWPELVAVWPAFADHYAATEERTVFLLTPQ